MKKLLRTSFDLSLLSFVPIISWFILSLIIDKNLINIFTLTYPFQFVWCLLKSIFSVGANISKEKDKNENAVMSGIFMCGILGFIIFGFLILNVEKYINFMNMDVQTYKVFTIYYFIQLYIQLIFSCILEKLYYENNNSLANKYSIIFNILNFTTLIGSALLFKDTRIVIVITLLVISVYVIIITALNFNKFKLKFNILKFIKYDSVDIFNNIAFFIIFLFGLSNALQFGPEYALAITFISLITDTQWDTFGSISTLAKIDISKNSFNYIEHRNNAYKLLAILMSTVFLLFISLSSFYHLDLRITLIFLLFEIVNFIIYPIYKLKTCFLQLEYSPMKVTSNKITSSMLRMLVSFLNTPYCTGLGQVLSSIYQFITLNFIFKKHFKVNKAGIIIKKV